MIVKVDKYDYLDIGYKWYKSNGGKLTKVEYRKTLVKLMKLIKSELLKGKIYRFHYKVGFLYVVGQKAHLSSMEKNYHTINWKKTKELGKIIRTLNLHTDERYYRIRWHKPIWLKTSYKNQYKFRPTTEFRKELNKVIMDKVKNNEELNFLEQ